MSYGDRIPVLVERLRRVQIENQLATDEIAKASIELGRAAAALDRADEGLVLGPDWNYAARNLKQAISDIEGVLEYVNKQRDAR